MKNDINVQAEIKRPAIYSITINGTPMSDNYSIIIVRINAEFVNAELASTAPLKYRNETSKIKRRWT